MNQENPHQFHVLIAAAGRGSRMDGEVPKQYRILCGKPVLRHSIETFMAHPGLASLRVIIDPNDADQYHDAVLGLDLPPPINGSNERNKSIFNGLKSFSNILNKGTILIHDAARPLVSPQDIDHLLQALQTHDAATLATPISSTIRKDTNGHCGQIIDRNGLWALQTPQGFRYNDLLKAHKNTDTSTTYTDDTSLVSALGIDVKLVPGHPSNIKITTSGDFDMVEKIMMAHYNDIRTGSGFDVHAFDTNTPGPVRLCGVDINHIHTLLGHSDADVGLHAITDAIFGAMGEGDIGQHFPPSDDTFKNMDSAIFLQKAMEILRDKNAVLKNIDLTLICEAPKIGPHTDNMKQRIAEITDLCPTRINVKATTTEKLGFTGRGEGIAAQAIATIGMQS